MHIFYYSSTNFSFNKDAKESNNNLINENKLFQPFGNNFTPQGIFNRKNYPNSLLWIPYYTHNQTNVINNNYINFDPNEKQNNNNSPKQLNPYINFPHTLEQANIPTPKKENFPELNLDIKPQKSEQTTTKFFTDYGGYGYKCSCSKTQCNRYYCECYRSGLFCIDCNCKNCKNTPPQNYVSNRHPTLNQNKTEIVTCTCTKSGCNKKYCECYKNGSKCNSACRCVGCENSENSQNGKKFAEIYECCPANSIYIIKNEIYEEKICEEFFEKKQLKGKLIEKKRKRSDSGDKENN